MRLAAAWRRRWWWWVLPLAFCALNLGFLWVHEASTSDGFRQLQRQLESAQRSLEGRRVARRQLDETVAVALQNEAGIKELYEQRFATEAARLTEVINEVKRLARRVGFDPPRLNYAEDGYEDFGLVQESIVFEVRGPYPALRQLVNLLEINELFLILSSVKLTELDGSTLGIDLSISTIFAVPAGQPPLQEAES